MQSREKPSLQLMDVMEVTHVNGCVNINLSTLHGGGNLFSHSLTFSQCVYECVCVSHFCALFPGTFTASPVLGSDKVLT